MTPRQDYQRRIAGIRKLGRDLSVEDVKALMGFVEGREDGGDGAPPSSREDGAPGGHVLPPDLKVAVVNEIMDLLLDQETLPDGIGDWLLGIAKSADDSVFAPLRGIVFCGIMRISISCRMWKGRRRR